MKKILVTGGFGFIGSNLVRSLVASGAYELVNIDNLGYSACPESLADLADAKVYSFEQIDLLDRRGLDDVFNAQQPHGVIHLAAESHVDRSIDGPGPFIQSNIVGTFNLLEASLKYWCGCKGETKKNFRFLHVSTDEVYGSLGATGLFTEETPYAPNSPYSASKAASDHLVRAWHHTYGLPTLISNCSNNYGPYQFPEKLIPLIITNAIHEKPLPIYGDGLNVRDWLYVEDHAKALRQVFENGTVGDQYNIGGHNECSNIDLVKQLCALLDELKPRSNGQSYEDLIEMVQDRAGHDRRYAIDASKIRQALGWRPAETIESGLRKTVVWYLENNDWIDAARSRGYSGERLGLAASTGS